MHVSSPPVGEGWMDGSSRDILPVALCRHCAFTPAAAATRSRCQTSICACTCRGGQSGGLFRTICRPHPALPTVEAPRGQRAGTPQGASGIEYFYLLTEVHR